MNKVLLSTVSLSIAAVILLPGRVMSAYAQDLTWEARDVGLSVIRNTNGVAVADYDRDGDLDVYLVAHASYAAHDPRTWNRLFANDGNGRFTAVSGSPGLAGRDSSTVVSSMGYKMGAAWGDYDNDGWPDLFLTHVGPNQLFHNNGDGTFTDVTRKKGLGRGKTQVSSSALWFDYDRDGDLDLYVSNWEDYASENRDKTNRLFENVGSGPFLDVSEASGLADGGSTWTSVPIDANNDGHQDLYLANDFGPNRLYLNNGNKTFTELTGSYGLEDIYHGMGIAIADCDHNGYPDVYLTNITESGFDEETNPLFLNTGSGVFLNQSVALGVSLAGWGWGTSFFDLENDGDEDLFVATGYYSRDYANVLFRNTSETGVLGFDDISDETGLADYAPARGLAVFDYDRDGDEDLLISNVTQRPSLYENPAPSGNHWLEIALEGTLSNRDGFGAVVEVQTGGRTYRKYHHGAQFLAQNIIPVHFGLGSETKIERLSVSWPSGHIDNVGPMDVNQAIRVRETTGVVGVGSRSVDDPGVPDRLRLLGTYPNPFRHATTIQFALGAPGSITIEIFDVRGALVLKKTVAYATAGEKNVPWRLKKTGHRPGAGLYVYRLRRADGTGRVLTGKMTLIR